MELKYRLFKKENLLWLLKHEIYRTERTGQPLTIIFLEMKYIERIIENFSLKSREIIIDGIENNLRKTDIKGWYDNEKLAIIMPSTSKKSAITAYNNLKEKIIGSLNERNIFCNSHFDKAWSIYSHSEFLLKEDKFFEIERLSNNEEERPISLKNTHTFNQSLFNYLRKIKSWCQDFQYLFK